MTPQRSRGTFGAAYASLLLLTAVAAFCWGCASALPAYTPPLVLIEQEAQNVFNQARTLARDEQYVVTLGTEGAYSFTMEPLRQPGDRRVFYTVAVESRGAQSEVRLRVWSVPLDSGTPAQDIAERDRETARRFLDLLVARAGQ